MASSTLNRSIHLYDQPENSDREMFPETLEKQNKTSSNDGQMLLYSKLHD